MQLCLSWKHIELTAKNTSLALSSTQPTFINNRHVKHHQPLTSWKTDGNSKFDQSRFERQAAIAKGDRRQEIITASNTVLLPSLFILVIVKRKMNSHSVMLIPLARLLNLDLHIESHCPIFSKNLLLFQQVT